MVTKKTINKNNKYYIRLIVNLKYLIRLDNQILQKCDINYNNIKI